MNVRCKFRLIEIRNHAGCAAQTFVFSAAYDKSIPEEQLFARFTPSGRFEMYVDNPPVQAQFKLGGEYYFDVTPASAA